MGAVHNEAHDNIRAAVKETRDQHDKTYGCDGNTGIVGIEQGQQRGDHAVDNVARYVTAAVSQARQNIDFSVFRNRSCRQNRLCLHGWIGFHETFSPSLVSLPIYSRPNKMHLIKLRFPACCKRIGLFRVQPACFAEIVLRNLHPRKA